MPSAELLKRSAVFVDLKSPPSVAISSILSGVLPVTLLVSLFVLLEVLLSVTPAVALSMSLALSVPFVGKLNTKDPLSDTSTITAVSQWNLAVSEAFDDDDEDALLRR